MGASTIGGINLLSEHEKREIYRRVIPATIQERFSLTPYFTDIQGRSLMTLKAKPGSTNVEMALYHKYGFRDPIFYGHLTDTMNGQIHILLYILNDPASPRFDVDIMPDGKPTRFGTSQRNLEAERDALASGLAPGQIRSGLSIFSDAVNTFENFVANLGHDVYFAEPLHYHNAIIFERYGFKYQTGRKLMERIHAEFTDDSEISRKLDSSTVFRSPEARQSIRLRSWAIHDGILGFPYTDVVMYKSVDKSAGISTVVNCTNIV